MYGFEIYDGSSDHTDRVATVREKSGKFQYLSESGKSQGILQFGAKVREFC